MKDTGSKKKVTRVAFDIGTRIIKALEVTLDGEKKTLTRFHFSEIDFPLTKIKAAEALKSMLGTFHPSVKEVNVSLSAPSAIVRFINMPRMTKEDLKNSLRFEAEKYIPFNINEVIVDANILGDATEDKREMRVLLAAAKKEAVESRISMMKDLGYSVSVIDIDSFACFNAFCDSFDVMSAEKSMAILNIGFTQTNVIIARGSVPYFTRDIQIGARDMAKSIEKELGVEEKESDRLIFNPKEKAAQVGDITKSVLGNLFDELRLSFGYYENQFGKSVNEIYLSGGIAGVESVVGLIGDNFGVKPVLWDPFAKFGLGGDVDRASLEQVRSKFAVCAGLAIRK